MSVPYGNFWGGDALYNLRIGIFGIEGCYRFRAKDTVPVNKLRYFNTYSFTKKGYHSGTGGKIRISLQDNTVGNIPSGKELSYALVSDPLNSPEQLLVDFDKTAVLEKGKIYHIVFSNYDDQPDINYVSIDMMAIFKTKNPQVPDQPELDMIDMTCLWRNQYTGWTRFKSDMTITPIFTLYYSVSEVNAEAVSVMGFGCMESWLREPRQIQGANSVRQRFVPEVNVDVKNIAVRIAKNGSPKDLKLSLFKEDSLIEVVEVKSDVVKPIDLLLVPSYRLGHDWIVGHFSKSHKLKARKQYYVVLSAEAGDAYEVFPLRDGSQFGYSSCWKNAYAEYNKGNGWVGWDAWGSSNLKMGQLQLYFNSNL